MSFVDDRGSAVSLQGSTSLRGAPSDERAGGSTHPSPLSCPRAAFRSWIKLVLETHAAGKTVDQGRAGTDVAGDRRADCAARTISTLDLRGVVETLQHSCADLH